MTAKAIPNRPARRRDGDEETLVSTIGSGGADACPDPWIALFRPCFADEGGVFLAKLRSPGAVEKDLECVTGHPYPTPNPVVTHPFGECKGGVSTVLQAAA